MDDDIRQQRLDAIEDVLTARSIRYFRPVELVRHTHDDWLFGEIYPPPERLAPHIGDTIELADDIRARWGGPVRVTSGYRCQPYNELVGGSPTSQHMFFRALDIQPVEPQSDDYSVWCEHVRTIVNDRRDDGFICGLGTYDTFCHIDTGYYDHQRTWSRR